MLRDLTTMVEHRRRFMYLIIYAVMAYITYEYLSKETLKPRPDINKNGTLTNRTKDIFATLTGGFSKETLTPRPNINKNGTLTNRTKDIYATFIGGFGNVIFQFAAVYSMTLAANCNKMFFTQYIGYRPRQAGRLIRFFPNLENLINEIEKHPQHLMRIKEPGPSKYHKKTTADISAAPQDVYLRGFLCVPTYWYPKYEKEIKELLVVSEELQTQARSYLMQISNGHEDFQAQIKNLRQGTSRKSADGITPLIGIQIRRGDKVKGGRGWLLPERPYFESAMDYFRKKFRKVYFVVVSEDKNWEKQNIIGEDVIYSMAEDDLLELALLTLCDHTIMSVGTFSWWAAYLAGGEVVYYPKHAKPDSVVAGFFNDTQYFLPHWKPISEKGLKLK